METIGETSDYLFVLMFAMGWVGETIPEILMSESVDTFAAIESSALSFSLFIGCDSSKTPSPSLFPFL